MSFDVSSFELGPALLQWLAVVAVCAVVATIVGFGIALLGGGTRGAAYFADALRRGVVDLTRLSWQRIAALATLTVREAFRKKTLYIFAVFILLFMFAGWFLQGQDLDKPAKPYVSFVLTSIRWILIPVAILLACWGLPADIKDRSLHTVVTKPVRRSEIVIGRILGYSVVTSLVLAIMSVVGYVWIQRAVPPRAQGQLISRVPVYGDMTILDRNGEPGGGVNVGDIWEFRGYIEGNTRARGVYQFENLNVDELKENDQLKLEYKFEAFRTHKGQIGEGIHFRLTLVDEDKGLRVPYPARGDLEIQEFAGETIERDAKPVIEIPRQLTYLQAADDESSRPRETTVDLFDDLMADGNLVVEVSCEDSGQYLGMAQPDLFIRMPDNSFATGYFKSMAGIWLMLVLVIMIGTTASTFLKGPVATLLTFGLVVMGQGLRVFMGTLLVQYREEGQVTGGGALESAYRLATQMNVQSPLPEGPATTLIKWIDTRVFDGLTLLQNVIPDFNYFNMTPYVANGFDVPWNAALLPSTATVLAYVIPCIVIGYFSLQLRELEAK
ncbi:MAG: ABC transporter permease [Maioricimonas sp. JB049]